MPAKHWTSLVVAAGVAIGLMAANEVAAQTAYAWANQPTANSYAPMPLYAFNPFGGVQIRRQGTGRYMVVFEEFGGDRAGSGGHAQVGSYGTADRCSVKSWTFQRPNFTVNVTCFKGGTAATPVDARFTVMATFGKGRDLVALPMMIGTPEIDSSGPGQNPR